MILFFVALLCFTFGCQQGKEEAGEVEIKSFSDEDIAASVIKDTFDLEEDDILEIVEFSLESQDTALVNFNLNGNQVSSKMKKTEADWKLSEIQNIKMEWIPADTYLMIKGRLISGTDEVIANKKVTLFQVKSEGGDLEIEITREIFIDADGVLYPTNPSTVTDEQGNFTILADRRYWEESGTFTLGVTHTFGVAYLHDLNNAYVTFTVDENGRRLELGEIQVKL